MSWGDLFLISFNFLLAGKEGNLIQGDSQPERSLFYEAERVVSA